MSALVTAPTRFAPNVKKISDDDASPAFGVAILERGRMGRVDTIDEWVAVFK